MQKRRWFINSVSYVLSGTLLFSAPAFANRTLLDMELSKTEIDQTVSQNIHQLTRCFVSKVPRPNKGKLVFKITADGQGRVTHIKLRQYTLSGPANKPFLKCVVKKIKTWKFPVSGVFSRTFIQPFFFEKT